MPTQIDLCNAALSNVGTRSTITSLTEVSNEARNCSIHWDFARRAILRSHNWSFAKKQITAALICAQTGTPENPNGSAPLPPWPWLYEYAWPQDCLRMRHQEYPPPQSGSAGTLVWTGMYPPLDGGYSAGMGTSATAKKPPFQICTDQDAAGNTIKVILSNLEFALFVYTLDTNDPNLWDAAFEEAFCWALAAKLAGPLTGDKEQAKLCAENAQIAVNKARIDDANESPTSTNHIPDWISARGGGMESFEYPEFDLTSALLVGGQ